MFFNKLFFAILAIFIGFAAADCDVKHVDTCVYGHGKTAKVGEVVEGEDHVCLSQGEGDYTFLMNLYHDMNFCIFDNACKVLGAAKQPDCGLPYVWMDNYLQYVLTITDAHTGGLYSTTYYSFDYANGKYSINNNHCECVDLDCKCAFPVGGEK
ncbi:predicted protein [Lichtheimia corymbifera JMRC:FSU:9682]|uniref:Uncharacterized protein n=1 Tax=Lichtheimia corymbifera JMRC:FSU:9682 TaxID=1263082 RepID=A0A068RGW8_9FUNG|nr:predicted protein [Lichtheimia corymbifera JMRC:FSU:9682]